MYVASSQEYEIPSIDGLNHNQNKKHEFILAPTYDNVCPKVNDVV